MNNEIRNRGIAQPLPGGKEDKRAKADEKNKELENLSEAELEKAIGENKLVDKDSPAK
jgi:hypothetical protein